MDSDFKTILAKAVVAVLKPLLRVLIRNEFSHAEFAELARQAYVDVAYEHFSIAGRKTTYSRVAVLTGLSRKEVVRLYKLREQRQLLSSPKPNRAVRVINGWLGDAEFLDKNNRPRDLPLQGDSGSFAVLVSRYSGDITLGAVVDELERVGVVSRPDKNTVRLTSMGYIPKEDELEKVRIMSVCAADLLDTAVHNIEKGEQDARLQRQIIHQNVPDSLVSEFRQVSSAKSSELLQDLNRLVSGRERQSAADAGARKRIGLGIYYFETLNQEGCNND